MRHILPLYFLVVFAFFIGDGICLENIPQIGQPAPQFVLNDVSGKNVSFADYKGCVVLINFWGTHCGPCKAEMPSLNNLYLAYKNDGLMVLAISIDSSVKPVKSFLKDNAIAFPVLMDPDKDVYFDEYGVLTLPASFLIDREGIIRDVIKGERVWDAPDMKEKIKKLLITKKGEGK